MNGMESDKTRRRYVDAKDVAELLGLPLSTVYDRTRLGRLPGSVRIGARIKYDLEKLEAWLDAGGDKGEA